MYNTILHRFHPTLCTGNCCRKILINSPNSFIIQSMTHLCYIAYKIVTIYSEPNLQCGKEVCQNIHVDPILARMLKCIKQNVAVNIEIEKQFLHFSGSPQTSALSVGDITGRVLLPGHIPRWLLLLSIFFNSRIQRSQRPLPHKVLIFQNHLINSLSNIKSFQNKKQ